MAPPAQLPCSGRDKSPGPDWIVIRLFCLVLCRGRGWRRSCRGLGRISRCPARLLQRVGQLLPDGLPARGGIAEMIGGVFHSFYIRRNAIVGFAEDVVLYVVEDSR